MKFQRLKDIREDNDKNQTEIGKILGHNQSYYAKLEKGIHNITAEDIYKLSKYYNISADYLLGLIDEPRELYPKK